MMNAPADAGSNSWMTCPSKSLDVHGEAAVFRIAVGIATAGRRDILSETLRVVSMQSQKPDMVFICLAALDDVDQTVLVDLPFETRVIQSNRGLTIQRNAIIEASHGFDLIAFLDDDFLVHPRYIEAMARCFRLRNDVVAASGLVLLDGVTGPGLSIAEAMRVLTSHRDDADDGLAETYNAYGCNMCVRLDAVRANALRFDEQLPLYGWLEDVDFCRRLSEFGMVVKNNGMVGVHLGVKSGRTSGVRFGYSQIANPIYIWGKGSTSFWWAMRHMAKNVSANILGLVRSEPWIDRRGRIKGNFLALRDLLCGTLHPSRISDLL